MRIDFRFWQKASTLGSALWCRARSAGWPRSPRRRTLVSGAKVCWLETANMKRCASIASPNCRKSIWTSEFFFLFYFYFKESRNFVVCIVLIRKKMVVFIFKKSRIFRISNLNEVEGQFARLWTECQNCAKSMYEKVGFWISVLNALLTRHTKNFTTFFQTIYEKL